MLLTIIIAVIVSYFVRRRSTAILVTLFLSLGLGLLQVFLMSQDRLHRVELSGGLWVFGIALQAAITVGIAWVVHRLKYGKSGDKFDIEGEELRRDLERRNQAVGAGADDRGESWKSQ